MAVGKIIYFSGPNCNVCDSLKPKVSELSKDAFPQFEWVEVACDTDPEAAAKYSVFTVPVVVVEIEDKQYLRFVRNFSMLDFEEKTRRLYDMVCE
ncbi:MAG: hypothetical protein RL226_1875 [Bacteroidota bacterium]|jgi:thioredoxin-like negative regulator of GroEL